MRLRTEVLGYYKWVRSLDGIILAYLQWARLARSSGTILGNYSGDSLEQLYDSATNEDQNVIYKVSYCYIY